MKIGKKLFGLTLGIAGLASLAACGGNKEEVIYYGRRIHCRNGC